MVESYEPFSFLPACGMKIDSDKKFATRECPSCACQVAENNNRCPICGYPFPAISRRKQTTVAVIAWVVLILFILVVFSGLFSFP